MVGGDAGGRGHHLATDAFVARPAGGARVEGPRCARGPRERYFEDGPSGRQTSAVGGGLAGTGSTHPAVTAAA